MSERPRRTSTRETRIATARHGMLPQVGPVKAAVKFLGITLAVVLVSGLSITAITLAQVSSSIETVALPGESNAPAPAPGVGPFDGGFNMLIVGSDECVDTGGCPGRTEKLNDFTMVLHVASDQQSATAISFPRDLIVPIPPCPLS